MKIQANTDNIYPPIQEVIDKIIEVVSNTISTIETDEELLGKILSSYVVGSRTNDMFSLSLNLSFDPYNEKTLNFLVVQNTKTADTCVIVTSGENDGLKILFKSINKYPFIGIEKYIPNIIKSTITILKERNE